MRKSSDFMNLVQQIRLKNQNPPSLEEITVEVEQERVEMYVFRNKNSAELYFASEQVLAKDWLNKDEDETWNNL